MCAAFSPQTLAPAQDGRVTNSLGDDVETFLSASTIVEDLPSSSSALPTLNKLGVRSLSADINPQAIAKGWIEAFETYIDSCDVQGILSLFIDDAFWRDVLAMTWDFRTFHTKARIQKFLQDRLAASKIISLELSETSVELQLPYPDLAWIQALFAFEVDAGSASGVFRLVPVPTSNEDLVWKAHVVLTNLEDLKGFPEKIGNLREQLPNHGKWVQKRQREIEFLDEEPKVIIVGAGHSGLEIAARLKYLGVPSLVVERHPRIGDNWRTRYEALCLHTTVWMDHMPYLPFPSSWPVYPPALKLADWLESYAHHIELNVWTSSEISSARQDEATEKWIVTVRRNDTGQERTFTVDHLVCALGWGGGSPQTPAYPGMGQFQGRILHASQFKTAKENIGKKVVVVGSCNSGHDICSDHVEHGVDVTMVQRSPTYVMSTKEGNPRVFGGLFGENSLPTDVADRISASFPTPFTKLMHKRLVKDIAEADKETLEGLERVGFKLSWGEDGAGYIFLGLQRLGGYYLDVGASQMIIDGKIKLKNDSLIERLTETGLKFEDGSELPCDVVIFATGYHEPRDGVIKLLGEGLSDRLKPLWGLDDEGELNGTCRDVGIPNLWCILGGLTQCRFYSKRLALQIKARLEGVWDGSRYSYT